jgi:signal transduction histidine kinase
VTGRSLLERTAVQLEDASDPSLSPPGSVAIARQLAYRGIMSVPMLREGAPIGTITLAKRERGRFTDKQVELIMTFADQAVIAIENARLFEEVQARTKELTESLEYQTATSEVLSVISQSPNNLQPVLDAIVATAQRLCQAEYTLFSMREGDNFYHIKASVSADPQFVDWVRAHPIAAGDGSMVGIVAAERQAMHFPDCLAEPRFTDLARQQQSRARTMLGVPLLSGGDVIGVIFLARTVVQPFTDRQVALVTTFANQAVIAIENTRLFEAEQARTREVTERTRELTEALEQQTATADVLKVISRSALDLQRVLDALVESAARLCNAYDAVIFQVFGDGLRLVAHHGQIPTSGPVGQPYPLDRGRIGARAVLDRRTIHITDILAEADEYPENRKSALHQGYRTALAIPLVHAGEAIGVIVIRRAEARPFAERQIELVNTFADQAVIAIENTRLFEEVQARTRELQESLEYQTAASDVLQVVSSSPGQLQPVYETMLARALRHCDAKFGGLFRYEDGAFRGVAGIGIPEGLLIGEANSDLKNLVASREPMHSPDLRQNASYLAGDPFFVGAVEQGGARAALLVPLLKEHSLIGALAIYRQEVRPFTDKQIQLVQTFADQAVIAIENTRLLNELRESLQQQTATADVLKVISRATFDLPKVLDTLVESAATLCDSYDTAILQKEGDVLRIVSRSGHLPSIGRGGTVPLTRGSVMGRAVIDRQTIHLADLQAETDEYPEVSAIARRFGFHTILVVPLVGASEAIGAITLRRSEVRPFTDRQIELLQTFADQAVIAIENTRLFEEVQARTRELAKTVEDLEIASQHKNQFVANMSHELRTPLAAILGYAELIQEGFYEPQGPKSLDALTRIRSNGKHLLGLINTVLDIAKIESGQFTLSMSEYAIESVVETVRAATESLAQNKKLTLTTSVDKSLPVGLGDEQRLTQVLLNLVGNAIKFTDVGEVRVTARSVNGHFAVSVADTGPGIPEQEQARIFDQFHQIDSSLTKAKGGTGLGLAIAKQIVEMHGGRIWVESTVGKGSTFQMEIPTRAEFRNRAL